jgi:DNA-binding NarL/FixJ family response regulator
MAKKMILTLVVISPGDLQNGILALMTTVPQLGAVLVAEDIESTLRMVENHQPALVIMDTVSTQACEVIWKIKRQWPQIHLIALVEDIDQQKEATAASADRVLVKGFSAQKLVEIIEDLTRVDKNLTQSKDQAKDMQLKEE